MANDYKQKQYSEEELLQRKKEQVKAHNDKMKQLDDYAKRIEDYANKIIIAENIDAAQDLYEEALMLYKEAVDFLNANKGNRHFVATTQAKIIDEKLNMLNDALKQKYDADKKDLDLATELVSLATNSKNYVGTSKERIDKIINMINNDSDYKIITEQQLKDLKRRLKIVAPKLAARILDSVVDASYIDAVKAINRKIDEKGLESKYLGCNVRMHDTSRTDEFAMKQVDVELGFEEEKKIDEYSKAVEEALSSIYDEVKVDSTDQIKLRNGKQWEIQLSLICKETIDSETKLAERNQAEAKRQLALQQEELKRKIEREEKAKEQAKLEAQSAADVKMLALKLAKCKNQDTLDALFDEAEEMHDDKKITDDQLKYLLSIYDLAEQRIKQGISDKDDSLYFELKYASQIAKAQSTQDIERLRKFIKQNFSEGRMNSHTFEALSSALEARRQKLMKPGFDSTADVRVLDIKPRKGESKQHFIARFMHATKAEYPDNKQRLAVAYSYWNKR